MEENREDRVPEERQKKGQFYLEPVIFLLGFGGSLIDTILTNVIQAQYCTAVLGRSQADCQEFYEPKLTVPVPVPQNDTETFTATFLMLRTLIEAGMPSLVAFFVGPWSDKFGRKPLIAASAFGSFVRCALYMIAINFPSLNPWYFLVCSIPYCIFGGSAFFLLGMYCYICDITSENRTTRFVTAQCAFIVGMIAGIQCAPYLISFFVVFAAATVLTLTSFLFASYILPESIPVRALPASESVQINPFNFKHLRDLKDACYTRQAPKNRFRILIIVSILFIALVAEWGDGGIIYLFLQKQLRIKLPGYALFVTYVLIIGNIEAILSNYIFTTKLKITDLNLLSLAIVLKLLGVFSTVFSFTLWHFYISRTLNGLIFLIAALTRSYLSTLVPSEQLGKILSLLIPVECFAQVFSSPIYTAVFNRTIDAFPQAVFLLSTVLMLFDLLLVIILMKLSKNEEINEDIDAPAEIDAPANPIPEETPGICYAMVPDMSHLNECR